MRKFALAIALIALLVTAAPPAVGAPSAMRVAKQALKTAKKALREARSTHATEIRFVDQTLTAPPDDFVRFDVRCARYEVAVAVNIGNGALVPVFSGSYGQGMLVSLYNPSATTPFDGGVQVACTWAADTSPVATMASAKPRATLEDQMQDAEAAVKEASD